MGHGTVADEIKGRTAGDGGSARADPRHRGGGRALPLLPRRLGALHGARDVDGGPGGAGLRPRARLRRVHAVPRRRATTPRARPSARTAGCAAAWTGTREHGPERPARLRHRPGRRLRGPAHRVGRRPSRRSGCDGIAIGGSLGADKEQMLRGRRLDDRGRCRRTSPRHLLGIGEIDDLVRGVELGIDTFDCAMPTRLGRHGMALVPDPEHRWRVDLTEARWQRRRRAADGRLPVPGLRAAATRAATCATCSRRAS